MIFNYNNNKDDFSLGSCRFGSMSLILLSLINISYVIN